MQLHALQSSGRSLPTLFPFRSAPRKSIFYGREIADGTRNLSYERHICQSSISMRSEGKRRRSSPQKNITSDGSTEKNKSSDNKSSGSSNQEEIIALFRRIQSSISKERSISTKRRNPNDAKEKHPLESVMDVLDQPSTRKQVKGEVPTRRGNANLPQSTGATKEESRKQKFSANGAFKLSRPPSNFVKRSPIREPLPLTEKTKEIDGEESTMTVSVKETDLQRIDELKITELKDLAKSKGLKGYSKLKKGELVEQLKRSLHQ